MSLNGYGVKFGIRFGSGLGRSCVFLLWMNEYVKFTLVVDVGCCGWLGKSQVLKARFVVWLGELHHGIWPLVTANPKLSQSVVCSLPLHRNAFSEFPIRVLELPGKSHHTIPATYILDFRGVATGKRFVPDAKENMQGR